MNTVAKIRSRLLLGIKMATAALMLTVQVASAQGPTPTDIDRMLSSVPPEEAGLMPYYKWANGASIEVLIVTGKQRGACVEIIADKLRREVALIRDLVPELRGLRDPRLVDWIPEMKLQAPLLIGLEMPHLSIEQAMQWYAKFNKPRTRLWDENRSTRMISDGDGFSVENGQLVQAYQWNVSSRGLDYSEDICRRSGWYTGGLYSLLGGRHFRAIASRWIQDMPDTPQRLNWWNLMDRLFLKALYSCPSSPVAVECTKDVLSRLVADPALVPWL